MPKPEIAVFFTGGTIGMDSAANGHGAAPGNNSGRLFAGMDQPAHSLKITPIAWADLPSPHVTPEVMLRLAEDIDEKLSCPQTLGAVVLHGTDLMAETAFFLDVALSSPKPVVVTGSMRSLSETGYDGLRNLEDALALCRAAGQERGVLALMAGFAYAAADVIKADSTSLTPLLSQNLGPIGRIVEGQAIFYRQPRRPDIARQLIKRPLAGLAEQVEILKCWPGMSNTWLELMLEHGLAGLVLEGFGAGNVPPLLLDGLNKALAGNIPVILTTRCPHSGVHPLYAYPGGGAQLLELGVINGRALTSDKAALLLKIALANGCGKAEIRTLCDLYGGVN